MHILIACVAFSVSTFCLRQVKYFVGMSSGIGFFERNTNLCCDAFKLRSSHNIAVRLINTNTNAAYFFNFTVHTRPDAEGLLEISNFKVFDVTLPRISLIFHLQSKRLNN